MAARISQISCFSSSSYITRSNVHLRQRPLLPFLYQPSKSKLSVAVSLEAHNPEASSSSNMPKLSHATDQLSSSVKAVENSYTGAEEHANGKFGINQPLDPVILEKKNTAKIHDFCFGIPFGGFVLTGGLLGSIFSRNWAALGTIVLFGGAILVFSTVSLKV